jgi:hypothetical protein
MGKVTVEKNYKEMIIDGIHDLGEWDGWHLGVGKTPHLHELNISAEKSFEPEKRVVKTWFGLGSREETYTPFDYRSVGNIWYENDARGAYGNRIYFGVYQSRNLHIAEAIAEYLADKCDLNVNIKVENHDDSFGFSSGLDTLID